MHTTTSRRRHRLLGASLAGAACLHGAAASSIATAIPSIMRTLHTSSTVAGGAIVGFFVGAVGSVLLVGRLADLLEPTAVLLTGLTVAACASVLGAYAVDAAWLITARVLLGAGTATVYPAAVRLLASSNAGQGRPPTSGLPVIVAVSEALFGLGPLLGAVVTVVGGWRAGCAAIAPLAGVAALGVWMTAPANKRPRRTQARGDLTQVGEIARQVDLLGALLATALVLVLLGILEFRVVITSWTAALPISAAALATMVVLRSRRRVDPFLDLQALTRPAVVVNLARVACSYIAIYLVVYGVPLWIERRGLGAVAAGVAIAPVALVSVAAVVATAPIVAQHGVRLPILISSAAIGVLGVVIAIVARLADPAPMLAVLAVLGLTCGASNAATQHANLAAAAVSGRVGASAAIARCTQFLSGQLAGVLVTELAPATAGGMRALGVVMIVLAAALATTSFSPRTVPR